MNPQAYSNSYSCHQQQHYQRQYNNMNMYQFMSTSASMYPAYLTPQPWGGSLQDHQSYHYHQQLMSRYNNRYWSGWSYSQWHQIHQFHVTHAMTSTPPPISSQNSWNTHDPQGIYLGPGPSPGPLLWQARMMYGNNGNNALTVTNTDVDQVDSHETQSEHQDQDNPDPISETEAVLAEAVVNCSDIKMVDITELDVSDISSDEGESIIVPYTVETPDCDAAENDVDVELESKTNECGAAVLDFNDSESKSKDAESLWIQEFMNECQKNYDNMIALSKDWDAIKEKYEILKTLSQEIDQMEVVF